MTLFLEGGAGGVAERARLDVNTLQEMKSSGTWEDRAVARKTRSA